MQAVPPSKDIQNVDMTIPEEVQTLAQTNSSRNVQKKADKSVVWT